MKSQQYFGFGQLYKWIDGGQVKSQLFLWPICSFPGDTLLQQKLQESNSRLYHNVSQTVRQVYSSATREVGWCVWLRTLFIIYCIYIFSKYHKTRHYKALDTYRCKWTCISDTCRQTNCVSLLAEGLEIGEWIHYCLTKVQYLCHLADLSLFNCKQSLPLQ